MSMFSLSNDADATIDALSRSLAIIEFDPTGTVLRANENFCRVLGYGEAEIKGQHHRIFCDPAYVQGPDYRLFWEKLQRGEPDVQEYKRIAKGGREVWIQASYNPVRGRGERISKVVKVATDITAVKMKALDDAGRLRAIDRVQAVIAFDTKGIVLDANKNFCTALGYDISEIRGKHHRMFCEPAYVQSAEYEAFWKKLGRGEFDARKYKRIGKGGREIWIQASYNPILDDKGQVARVVKFATDVTDRVQAVTVLAGGLSRLSAGDLAHEIAQAFPPALEQLRLDFNASIQSLRSVVSQVRETADLVESGTGEIRDASGNLSKRTEQQAASLEETAAALEEITSTVRKTAEGTRQAHQAMIDAKTGAESSGKVVERAMNAMAAIEKSSSEVNQIISVIDEIAFQTNLLALNAGVEAARAGEAGRGFAVVASEVRALAQRSAEAAKQIKELIVQSTSHVDSGVKLVGSTGEALREIIRQVNQVASVISNINAAAGEQSSSLGEVNTAINQLDQITQQNAAMVEEATAASSGINDKARELNALLARFIVGTGGSAARAGRGPASNAGRRPAIAPVRRAGSTAVAAKAAAGPDWQDF